MCTWSQACVASSELNGVLLSKSRVGSVEGIQPDSGKEGKADSNPSVQQEKGEEEEEGAGEEGDTEEDSWMIHLRLTSSSQRSDSVLLEQLDRCV